METLWKREGMTEATHGTSPRERESGRNRVERGEYKKQEKIGCLCSGKHT